MSDFESFKQALEASVRAQVEAEAERRIAEVRAAAEREIADVRAAALREISRIAQDAFFERLHYQASAACVSGRPSAASSSGSDSKRLFQPDTTPITVADLPFAAVQPATVLRCWNTFKVLHKTSRVAKDKRWPAPVSEVKLLNPVLELLVQAAQSWMDEKHLTVHFQATLSDSLSVQQIRPDGTVVTAGESAFSVRSAVAFIEGKLPSQGISSALQQAHNYARRGLRAVAREAFDRGDDLSKLYVTAVGITGAEIAFTRVWMGGPERGAPFSSKHVPFPSEETGALPLLDGWDGTDPRWAPPAVPPAGFRALVALLASPANALRPDLGGELRQVTGLLHAAACASVPEPQEPAAIHLSGRLGSGGTSDVFAVTAVGGGGCLCPLAAWGTDAGPVLKLPRAATAHTAAMCEREINALLRLQEAPSGGEGGGVRRPEGVLPLLCAYGERTFPGAERTEPERRQQRAPWRLLLLHPRGLPLALELRRRLGALSAAGAAAPSAAGAAAAATGLLRELADRVASDALLALQFAHARGVVHGDVRCDNIVWAGAGAVVVDWGLAAVGEAEQSGSGGGDSGGGGGSEGAGGGSSRARKRPSVASDVVGVVDVWLAVTHSLGPSPDVAAPPPATLRPPWRWSCPAASPPPGTPPPPPLSREAWLGSVASASAAGGRSPLSGSAEEQCGRAAAAFLLGLVRGLKPAALRKVAQGLGARGAAGGEGAIPGGLYGFVPHIPSAGADGPAAEHGRSRRRRQPPQNP